MEKTYEMSDRGQLTAIASDGDVLPEMEKKNIARDSPAHLVLLI